MVWYIEKSWELILMEMSSTYKYKLIELTWIFFTYLSIWLIQVINNSDIIASDLVSTN